MTPAEQLLAWDRENLPPPSGAGDITNPKLLAELLLAIANGHIERTAPRDVPDRLVQAPSGLIKVRGEAAAPFVPAMADQTDREIVRIVRALQGTG